MNIIPFNLNKISFKGNSATSEVKTDDSFAPEKETKTQSLSNPISASQINIKTPISYKKIAEIPLPECDKPATLYKLANGQKVVILPKEGPAVVRTFYNVGSMNEPDHLRGISHFIEHNLFNGTDKLAPGEFFKKVSSLGANTNAMTGYNQTNYFIKSQLLKDNYLEEMISLHADQLQNPKFAPDQLIKEKGPVTSEISMYADNPFNVGRNLALKNLYQVNSASKDLIAGTIQNINAIKREDVVDYYNTWYTPDNATTVITGNVTPEQAIELVSKNFTKNKTTQSEKRKYETLIPTEKPIRVDRKMPKAYSAIINMGFSGPENSNTKDKVAIEALSVILSGYTSARLTKALEPMNVGAEFSFEKVGNKKDDKQGLFIGAAVPDEKSEETLKTIYKEIANLIKNPPTQEELDIAKSKLKMGLSEYTESSLNVNEFIGNAFLDNDINYLTNYKNILESLTQEDISNVAKKYLDLNKVSISVIHPEKVSNEQINSNYNKTNASKQAQIAFGSSNQPTNIDNLYSNLKEYKLQNNLEVVVQPTKTDFASYQMCFSIPTDLDVSLPEIAILDEMLNRGSLLKDKETFNGILDKSNMKVGYAISQGGLSIYGKSPQDKINQIMSLTKEVLLSPRFTKEDFEWAKNSVKESLECQPKNASNKLDAYLYPQLSYMAPNKDSLKKLDNISLERIKAIYQTIMANLDGQAVLSAPTEKNPQIATDFMNSLSTHLPQFRPFNSSSNVTKTYTKNETPKILTETEQRLQAEVVQAYKYKVTGNIQDEAKLSILNMVLGGNSSSRLFSDLRESQKLAYYVASKRSGYGDTETIRLNILTTTDDPSDPLSSPKNINKSLDGFKKHIDKLKTELISEEELEKAKLIFKNNILNSLETSFDKALDITGGKASRYGLSHTKQMLEAIDKVTVKDVQNAALYAFKNPPVTSIVASQKSLDEAGIKEN